MLKRALHALLAVSMIVSGFTLALGEVNAGTNPEPVFLLPTDDTMVRSNQPNSNMNLGENTHESMVELRASTSGGNNFARLSYLKFDITSLQELSPVNNAKIRIYGKNNSSPRDRTLQIYGVENVTWEETTLTWNQVIAPENGFNFDTYSSSGNPYTIATITLGAVEGYAYADITDYVQAQYNSGKTHITLAFVGQDYDVVAFHSKDTKDGSMATHPPYLIINADTEAPTAPANVIASTYSTTAIQLQWDSSVDNVKVDRYQIYYEDGSLLAETAPENNSYIADGLQPSTTYSFYLQAVDSSGNVSAASEIATARTDNLPDDEPPSQPDHLTGKALSTHQVQLSWDSSTDNIGVAGYYLYDNAIRLGTLSAGSYAGYIVEGLSAGASYSFSVAAFDIAGNESVPSEPVIVTTLTQRDQEPPAKPDNLRADHLTFSNIDLAWDPSDDNIETMGYVVYINGHEKARVSAPAYLFTDGAPFTDYSVVIRAFDFADNLSEASEPLQVTTPVKTIRWVEPSGADGAYTTITAGIAAAVAGDAVVVKNGTYSENITIAKSGTASEWITIRAAEGESPTIKGNIIVNGSYIRFDGFKMDGRINEGVYNTSYAIRVNALHSQVVNMHVENYASTAFYFDRVSAGYSYVADNYVYNSAGAFQAARDSVFEGNEIDSLNLLGNPDGTGDTFRVFGSNVIFRNNYAHGTVRGGHMGTVHVDVFQSWDDVRTETKNILIENNVFTGWVHQGLMLENDTFGASEGVYYISDWTVRNNIFSGFSAWGVCGGKTNGGIPNLIIENNVFIGYADGGGYNGVKLIGVGGSGLVRNNIIMNTTQSSYGAEQGAVLLEGSGNNLIYNAVLPDVIADSDIIGLDPRFVNPASWDYHLQPDSPAIDAGAAVGFNYDLDGNFRPYGNAVDIGAYEFHGVRENTPPLITITAPVLGQTYPIGSDAEIRVNARDDKMPIKVDFFVNDEKVGESTEAPFDFAISNLQEGTYKLYAVVYDEEGLFTRSNEVVFVVSDTEANVARNAWQNVAISPAREGLMRASFDMIPLVDKMDGLFGFTLGQATAYNRVAAVVRFNNSGYIDARNGGAYNANMMVPYSAGKQYHFIVFLNIPASTYSAFVVDEEGRTYEVARDYMFRTEMSGINSIDHSAIFAETGSYVQTGLQIATWDSVDVTPPTAPTNVRAVRDDDDSVIVSWHAATDDNWIAGYRIYRNGVEIGQISGSTLEYVDLAPVAVGVIYTVRAYDAAGNLSEASIPASSEQLAAVLLNAVDRAAPGESFEVFYGVQVAGDRVYSQEVVIAYDTDLLEYVSVAPAGSHTVLAWQEEHDAEEGTLTFILAHTDNAQPINGSHTILKLAFKARDAEGNGSVIVTDARLGTAGGNILFADISQAAVIVHIASNQMALTDAIQAAESLYEEAVVGVANGQYPEAAKDIYRSAIEAAKTVRDQPDSTDTQIAEAISALQAAQIRFAAYRITPSTGDFNKAVYPGIDIGDLAIIAMHYGSSSNSTDWNEVYDLDGDGMIGLYELSFIAGRILGN